MRQLKALAYIFVKSLLSLEYYKSVVNSNIRLTIKYFIILGMFGALLNTAIISAQTLPQAKTGMQTFLEEARSVYPEDLVINFENDEWTMNKEEPFVIGFPVTPTTGDENNTEPETPDIPKNLIVLDHQGTTDDLEKYNALMVMNANNIIIKQASGTRSTPLQNFPDSTIDKTKIDQTVKGFETILKIIPVLIVIFVFFVLLAMNIGMGFIYILLITSILWVLSNFLADKFKFSQIFRISVHTMTLPVTLQIILGTAGLILSSMNTGIELGLQPSLYLISNILLGSMVMLHLSKK